MFKELLAVSVYLRKVSLYTALHSRKASSREKLVQISLNTNMLCSRSDDLLMYIYCTVVCQHIFSWTLFLIRMGAAFYTVHYLCVVVQSRKISLLSMHIVTCSTNLSRAKFLFFMNCKFYNNNMLLQSVYMYFTIITGLY